MSRYSDKRKLKYTVGQYVGSELFAYAPEEKVLETRLFRVREEKRCSNCQGIIPSKDYAFYQKAIIDRDIKQCYACIKCLDKHLDSILETGEM